MSSLASSPSSPVRAKRSGVGALLPFVGRAVTSLFPSIRVLRLSAYLFVVFTVLGLIATRAVVAQMSEAGLRAGREIAKFSRIAGPAEVILLNGERFRHGSNYTKENVTTVLDRVEEHCRENLGLLGGALDTLSAEAKSKLDPRIPRADRSAVIRDEGEGGGMVACFVDAKPASLGEFRERLERMLATRDLSELGRFRYVYAERVKNGETHVVALALDSGLRLDQMFPATGDAAGEDSKVVPRPPESRRTLSAAAQGMPFGVRVYMSEKDGVALDRFYNKELAARGFKPAKGARFEGTTAFLDKTGYQVFVSIVTIEGKSYVTLTEAGRADGGSIVTVEAE
jgi:hypothetical protein